MNNKVKDTVKGIAIAIAVVFVLIIWDLFMNELSEDLQGQLDEIFLYGTIGGAFLLGAGVCIFLFSNFFREVYTESVLQRANSLLEVCLDEEGKYLYIVADLYRSGEGDGFYVYRHYLFDIGTGKKFIYKPKKLNREDPKAIEYFRTTLNQNISIVLNSESAQRRKLETENHLIKISSFKSRFDFGFKISCCEKGNGKVVGEWRI